MNGTKSEATTTQEASTGVKIVRSLQNGSPDTPLKPMDSCSLPLVATCRSTCKLVQAGEQPSLVKRESVISEEDDDEMHYTHTRPFAFTILQSRYLTQTAKPVNKLPNDIEGARRRLDQFFPLLGSDRNGKRVMELTLSLPNDGTFPYAPGDSIGMQVPNRRTRVSSS